MVNQQCCECGEVFDPATMVLICKRDSIYMCLDCADEEAMKDD